MEVKTIRNSRGEKYLLLDDYKFRKDHVKKCGKVMWRCTKTRYCQARLYTRDKYSNFVVFAKLNHDHARNHIFVRQFNYRVKRQANAVFPKITSDTKASKENIKNEHPEGPWDKKKKISELLLNVKKEKEEEPTEEKENQFSSIQSTPENPDEIVFPYTVPKKNKVELIPQTEVWVFKDALQFIKKCSKDAQASMIRCLLRHLLGPQNLKYMKLFKGAESGTIPMPEKLYSTIRLFVTQNCTSASALSWKEFNECMKNCFDNARTTETSVETSAISYKANPTISSTNCPSNVSSENSTTTSDKKFEKPRAVEEMTKNQVMWNMQEKTQIIDKDQSDTSISSSESASKDPNFLSRYLEKTSLKFFEVYPLVTMD